MFDRLDDTIVAISSAPGASPRGIIRLSGPDAYALAGRVFQSGDGSVPAHAQARRRLAGCVSIDAETSVPAEAYCFRAPASYTRQDLIELHTIGAIPILALLLEKLTALGARPAEPGEFTARAFFSGAMDLTCVEGVAAMIASHNDAQLRASHAMLHGRLSRTSSTLRAELADVLARVEADIDFAEEPIDFLDLPSVSCVVDAAVATLSALVDDAPSVEQLETLPTVMLTGLANAGKSTLFNRLTGMDRVIASAVAGTTRDIISSPLKLADGQVTLLDSAGLSVSTADTLEGRAEQLARDRLASAEVVVLVADVNTPIVDALAPFENLPVDRPWCVAVNKTDTVASSDVSRWIDGSGIPVKAIPVCALTGKGMETLLAHLNDLVFTRADRVPTDRLALSNRQRQALHEALHALSAARQWCVHADATHAQTELLAVHLHEAIDALCVLEGRLTTDELLDRIFSRFCIGK